MQTFKKGDRVCRLSGPRDLQGTVMSFHPEGESCVGCVGHRAHVEVQWDDGEDFFGEAPEDLEVQP